MTPKAYKQHGKGQKIYYSVVKSPLGLLLLAATKKGICAVRIGDSRKDLIDELKNEFKNADLNETKLQRAVNLSVDKYCGVIRMFRDFAEMEFDTYFHKE